MAAASATSSGTSQPLTDAQLRPIVAASIERLTSSLGSTLSSALQDVTFHIVDLPDRLLGQALPQTILIDRDAAGFGWFVDTTPYDDQEFVNDRGPLLANVGGPAENRMDLLTTVMHELAHVVGFQHDDPRPLMDSMLPLGTRHLLEPLEEAFCERESKLTELNVDAFYEFLNNSADRKAQRLSDPKIMNT
jgi:hypothetical protein